MIFFIIFCVAIWGFNPDAPVLVRQFTWFMFVPILVTTIFGQLFGG